jgi:hypothetical protein
MSSNDIDIKKRLEKAALIHLGASFLKVPQAMRAAGFSVDRTQKRGLISYVKQQHIRRSSSPRRGII